jgi:DNA-binding response OmpR family regulator
MADELILVVDDDEDLGAVLLEVIQANGYRGKAICTLGEARIALAEERPALVLLDWNLPGGDAAEIAELCHESGVPVVLSSASADAHERGRSIGAAGVLTKPFDSQSLYGLIDHILYARSPHP